MSTLDANGPHADRPVDHRLGAPDITTAVAGPAAGARALLRLYLVRGLLALAWSAGFARLADPLTTVAGALLVAYPVIDLVASLIDSVHRRGAPGRGLLQFNAASSALAAITLAAASAVGPAAVLHVFGLWAVVSGAAQVVVALRRRGPRTAGQWPMLLAGGLSVLAGVSYVLAAMGDDPRLGVLAVYAAGGGTFFVIQAGLEARRLRRTSAAHPR